MTKQYSLFRFLLLSLCLFAGGLTAWAQLPGTLPPAGQSVTSDQPGSVLIYPYYSSSPKQGEIDNTEISITNTNPDPEKSISVHLFFVASNQDLVSDTYICLVGNQTARFLASDIDPGLSGYIVAVAVDAGGWPISANYLLGGAGFKLKSGHAASLPALAVPALYSGAMPGSKGQTATLQFDGKKYAKLPRMLAANHIPSPADGNSTLLIVNRIGGELIQKAPPIGLLSGFLLDDAANALSFAGNENSTQLARVLSNDFPQTTPRFSTFIPSERSGWLKIWGTEDIGLVGAVINLNPKSSSENNVFSGGRLLQQLTQTAAGAITIQVIPSSCEQPPPATKSDFAVMQTASTTTIAPNGEITYTVKVTNNGPDEGAVIVSNNLTGAAKFTACTFTGSPVSNSGCFGPNDLTRLVTYLLKKGQTETITLKALVAANAANDSKVEQLSVGLTKDVDDQNQDNNFAETVVTVKAQAATFELSGRAVMRNGLPLRDVMIHFDVNGQTLRPPVKTDGNGNWKQTGFEVGPTYRVTPVKAGCNFAPNTQTARAAANNLNFICR